MNDEYFIIPRALLDSVFWTNNEPLSKKEALVELFSMASDEDRTLVINGEEVAIPKGSIALSPSRLAAKWLWDRKEVCRLIRRLEKHGHIRIESHRLITVISLTDLPNFRETKESSAMSQLLKATFWEEH